MTRQKKIKRNRSVTKAKLLFIYIMASGVFSFLYAISCLFTGFSFWYAAIPFLILIIYWIGFFFWKNWKMIWVFIQDTSRGRLLIFLNENTHWDYTHKMKIIEWVYPRRSSIRNERRLILGNKLQSGLELSKSEKKELQKNVVTCPQQLLDGFNRAMLINALIWGHTRIQVLDDEIRDILELTDENMYAFDINDEIAKCKVKK